jgi:hypothetical protein
MLSFFKRHMDLGFVFAAEAITELDAEYNNCRAAIKQFSVNEIIDSVPVQIVNACLIDAETSVRPSAVQARRANREHEDLGLLGMSCAILYVRKIVFGIAPALSFKEPNETHEITMRIMLKIIKLLEVKTPNMFLSGVSLMFSLVGVRFANNKSIADEFIAHSGTANRQLKLMESKNPI